MSEQAWDVFGVLKGEKPCVGCGRPVEPWVFDHGLQPITLEHLTCFMVRIASNKNHLGIATNESYLGYLERAFEIYGPG